MTEIFGLRLSDTDTFEKHKETFLELLPSQTRQNILRYKKPYDLQRSLLGEIMARKVIANQINAPIDSIEITKSEKGKPFIITRKDAHFNISHSGNWVVMVFSNHEVGVDIEKLKPVDFRVARRFFSPMEIADLEKLKGELKRDYFFTLWTLKESYLKLLGRGLTKTLNSFTIMKKQGRFTLFHDNENDHHVFFKQFRTDNEHIAAVCSHYNEFSEPVNVLDIEKLLDL